MLCLDAAERTILRVCDNVPWTGQIYSHAGGWLRLDLQAERTYLTMLNISFRAVGKTYILEHKKLALLKGLNISKKITAAFLTYHRANVKVRYI